MAEITTNSHKKLVTALVESAFVPTIPQQKCKAAFWYNWNEGASKSTSPTLEDARRITRNATVTVWGNNPQFEAWFLNKNSFYEDMEHLLSGAPAVLAEIITHADKPSDRISAIKLVLEVMGKMKKPTMEVQFKDDFVNKMTPEQLEEMEIKLVEKARGEIS